MVKTIKFWLWFLVFSGDIKWGDWSEIDLPICSQCTLSLPSENIRNRSVFWCFQEVEKGCTGNEWVKKEFIFNRLVANKNGAAVWKKTQPSSIQLFNHKLYYLELSMMIEKIMLSQQNHFVSCFLCEIINLCSHLFWSPIKYKLRSSLKRQKHTFSAISEYRHPAYKKHEQRD